MLSEEKISAETPKPIRIKFRKVGMLKYISHLDLQRTFARVLTRSGIPVWYTQGFNPHIKMVFSLPLSVGSEGECEYLDIKITEPMTFGEMKYRLDASLTDELSVIDIYEPRDDFHDIAYAGYDIVLCTPHASEELAESIRKLFSASPIMMTKKTKSGEKEVDIFPMIKSLAAEYSDGDIVIRAVLSASSDSYLNPEMLVTAAKNSLGIMNDIMHETYTIMRTDVYLSDGVTEFR